ncbi:hypothetical protein [Shewanella salipaludis]|uniref:MotA/TolQ/ExbB proton channel family protein n=1 Tax=Shewanella salipaludis TaxID=2723052 RepID=A0A972FZX1_9GAMM|nr:hypothetical protein [Shewanella salipaludis]NMH66253.1 MotA/TolQ/ExbB proton channel family protein [Shewanella salipaludis]
METVEVNWSNATRVWWSFFWRATLFGAIGGAILGAIMGVIAVLVGGNPDDAAVAGGIAGYLVAIPVSIWCIKFILNKSFKGYRVCLLKDPDA